MDQELKKNLIEELEKSYVLIKKGTLYYFMGGMIATAIAIIGLSYASAKSAIQTETAKLAIDEIKKIKNDAIKDQEEISKILASTPDLLNRIPKLENRIDNLANATDDIGSVKRNTQELFKRTQENREAIAAFADAFNHNSAKVGYIYPKGYFRDPELTALIKDLEDASKESARVFNLK